MPTQMEMLAVSMHVASKLDPDAPPPVVVSHAVVEGSGNVAMQDDDAEEFGANENNARVAFRLRAEKERIMGVVANGAAPVSFHRAGDPANPTDISAGGLGGANGDAAAPGTSDVADQLAHLSAWGLTHAAVDATKRATPVPPAGGDLLGDDKAPPAPEGQGGSTDAGANAWGQPPGQ